MYRILVSLLLVACAATAHAQTRPELNTPVGPSPEEYIAKGGRCAEVIPGELTCVLDLGKNRGRLSNFVGGRAELYREDYPYRMTDAELIARFGQPLTHTQRPDGTMYLFQQNGRTLAVVRNEEMTYFLRK